MIAAKRAVHIQKVRAAPADIEPQQRRNVCNVERKLRRTGFDNGHTLSSKLDASSGFLLQIVQQNRCSGFENIVRLIAAIEVPLEARRAALRNLFERPAAAGADLHHNGLCLVHRHTLRDLADIHICRIGRGLRLFCNFFRGFFLLRRQNMKIRYFFLCCTDRLLLPHIYRNGRKAVRNVLHIRRGCFRNVLFSGRGIHIHRRRCFCGSFLRNVRFGFLDSCFFDFCLDRHF